MNGPRRSQAGLSSAEVLIMATVMSVLMIMVTESMSTLSGVRLEQRAAFRLGDVADQVARRIERDIDYATRVFSNTAEDNDYFEAMDVGVDLQALGNRLPQLTTHGYFEPDSVAQPETGNILFLARRGPRVEVKYGMVADYHVQPLVFTITAPVPANGALDLLRWTSDPLVDYWDVAEIADPNARADVLSQLYDNGVRFAWDSSSPRSTGLFEITPAGGLRQLASDGLVTGGEAPDSSRPYGRRRMQIAANGMGGKLKVPAYARTSGTFPGGFELKIDGSASGKLLMLRMVIEAQLPHAREVSSEIHRFFSTQG